MNKIEIIVFIYQALANRAVSTRFKTGLGDVQNKYLYYVYKMGDLIYYFFLFYRVFKKRTERKKSNRLVRQLTARFETGAIQ